MHIALVAINPILIGEIIWGQEFRKGYKTRKEYTLKMKFKIYQTKNHIYLLDQKCNM